MLLEPVMAVEVVLRKSTWATIIGDLNSRRGRIEGMEQRAGTQIIKAIVPLAEMFGYATDMRSSTQGRATYSMHFARYEEVPRSRGGRNHRASQGNEAVDARAAGESLVTTSSRDGVEIWRKRNLIAASRT